MKQKINKFLTWLKKFWWILLLPLPVVLYFLFFNKKNSQHLQNETNSTHQDYASIFADLLTLYPRSFLKQIERLYRLETAHFKSTQYLKTFTPGMVQVPGKKSFPYGWSSLKEYAEKNALSSNDFGTVYFANTSDGIPRHYIKFPSRWHAVNFITWFLYNKRDQNVNAWYSLNPAAQQKYANKLSQINTHYV
jgi:hypothetical protein